MQSPDFENAKLYALEKLQNGLSSALTYHSLSHTKDEVVPAAENLAKLEKVKADDMVLLQTAAWFHDIGFTKQKTDHELVGTQIVKVVLPKYNYSTSQIQVINDIIMATQLPQTPKNLLEMIMADADLVSLGAENFLERSLALREEMASSGTNFSDIAWYEHQINFLRQHKYFTKAAIKTRQPIKEKNLTLLHELLENAKKVKLT